MSPHGPGEPRRALARSAHTGPAHWMAAVGGDSHSECSCVGCPGVGDSHLGFQDPEVIPFLVWTSDVAAAAAVAAASCEVAADPPLGPPCCLVLRRLALLQHHWLFLLQQHRAGSVSTHVCER